ncbi:MAG: hypothetical protein KI786_02775, partial [Mameliella sp.]|nr:hypothetical protein [Phaeodactylibacter sp.]
MAKIDIEKSKNEDAMKLLLSRMQHRLEKIYKGGGERKIEKLHKKGKMTARERIERLIDKDSDFLEIGAFAGFEMYKEHG